MHQKINQLLELLGSGKLARGNSDRCVRIFYDAAKVIYYKQERLHKSQLKMKEIAAALTLVQFHHTNAYHFDVVGQLAENFGECPETKALVYYDKNVMGTIADQFGRKITIDEDGMKSFYKERESGRHIVAPENYEESRGKRLPWIRYVLENSISVYLVEEKVQGKFRRSYIYTAVASIPAEPKPRISYFVAVISEDRNKNLKFVTAYDIYRYNRFLKCIEPGLPWRNSGEPG